MLNAPAAQRTCNHRTEEHRHVCAADNAHGGDGTDYAATFAAYQLTTGITDQQRQEISDHRPDQLRQRLLPELPGLLGHILRAEDASPVVEGRVDPLLNAGGHLRHNTAAHPLLRRDPQHAHIAALHQANHVADSRRDNVHMPAQKLSQHPAPFKSGVGNLVQRLDSGRLGHLQKLHMVHGPGRGRPPHPYGSGVLPQRLHHLIQILIRSPFISQRTCIRNMAAYSPNQFNPARPPRRAGSRCPPPIQTGKTDPSDWFPANHRKPPRPLTARCGFWRPWDRRRTPPQWR